jgi:hypothetical protein
MSAGVSSLSLSLSLSFLFLRARSRLADNPECHLFCNSYSFRCIYGLDLDTFIQSRSIYLLSTSTSITATNYNHNHLITSTTHLLTTTYNNRLPANQPKTLLTRPDGQTSLGEIEVGVGVQGVFGQHGWVYEFAGEFASASWRRGV